MMKRTFFDYEYSVGLFYDSRNKQYEIKGLAHVLTL